MGLLPLWVRHKLGSGAACPTWAAGGAQMTREDLRAALDNLKAHVAGLSFALEVVKRDLEDVQRDVAKLAHAIEEHQEDET